MNGARFILSIFAGLVLLVLLSVGGPMLYGWATYPGQHFGKSYWDESGNCHKSWVQVAKEQMTGVATVADAVKKFEAAGFVCKLPQRTYAAHCSAHDMRSFIESYGWHLHLHSDTQGKIEKFTTSCSVHAL
jgi:hypothetical protein